VDRLQSNINERLESIVWRILSKRNYSQPQAQETLPNNGQDNGRMSVGGDEITTNITDHFSSLNGWAKKRNQGRIFRSNF
jgi:hypothetical protein